MITDRLPAGARLRREYDRSDALVALPLPAAGHLQPLATALAEAMESGAPEPVGEAAGSLLAALASFYEIPAPGLRVLGVRPHRVSAGVCTYQLFGDYTPSTQRIRVWMRTAIREKVASPRALLNVLLHEFCHHLDVTRLACPESFHTRGFFTRIDALYHHALGTPPDARRPLRWLKRGGVWTIDWQALRARSRT